MTWTAPITWVDGAVLTSAQLNTNLRDNFLEQIPAKSTNNGGAGGGYFTIAAPHGLRERGVAIHEISSSQSTTSQVYDDLASVGPFVSVRTGTRALVLFQADGSCTIRGKVPRCTVEVAGTTVQKADDSGAALGYSDCNATSPATVGTGSVSTRGGWLYFQDLNPGLNYFIMKYATSDGTATFSNRRLHVFPL